MCSFCSRRPLNFNQILGSQQWANGVLILWGILIVLLRRAEIAAIDIILQPLILLLQGLDLVLAGLELGERLIELEAELLVVYLKL